MDFWKTVGRSVVAPSERDQNWIGSSFRGESDKGKGNGIKLKTWKQSVECVVRLYNLTFLIDIVQ
jgi:hypothetical protein